MTNQWPPPEARKANMNKSTAIILMVLMSLALVGGGVLLVSRTGTAAAGWALIIVGSVASLSTMGVLTRVTK